MKDGDKKRFVMCLMACSETFGRGLSEAQIDLYFGILKHLDIETVERAFRAHLGDSQRGRFMPVPADILDKAERFQKVDARPGAEEAWAMAIRYTDENDTFIVNDELMEAYSIARPILDVGDKVGARMAFKEAYERIVTRNKADGIKVNWWPSLGLNVRRREAVIQQARASGLLEADHAKVLLPPPDSKPADANEVAAISASRERFQQEIAKLRIGMQQREEQRVAKVEAERAELQRRKQEIADQALQYLSQRGLHEERETLADVAKAYISSP